MNGLVNKVYVWDILIRCFHWSLVFFFIVAYITEDDFETIHVWSGYIIAGLISIRLLWGLVGSKHARFVNFVRRPKAVVEYLKLMLSGQSKRYVGHNPAGAAMIVTLLVSLGMTLLFGCVLLAVEKNTGPFAGLFISQLPEGPVEALHELFANATLLLVGLHVLGVLFSSLLHRENLVRAMWTGYKERRANQDVPE